MLEKVEMEKSLGVYTKAAEVVARSSNVAAFRAWELLSLPKRLKSKYTIMINNYSCLAAK